MGLSRAAAELSVLPARNELSNSNQKPLRVGFCSIQFIALLGIFSFLPHVQYNAYVGIVLRLASYRLPIAFVLIYLAVSPVPSGVSKNFVTLSSVTPKGVNKTTLLGPNPTWK